MDLTLDCWTGIWIALHGVSFQQMCRKRPEYTGESQSCLVMKYNIQKSSHGLGEQRLLIDIQHSAHALVITQALVTQFYKRVRLRVKKPLTQKAKHFRTLFRFQDILHFISFQRYIG